MLRAKRIRRKPSVQVHEEQKPVSTEREQTEQNSNLLNSAKIMLSHRKPKRTEETSSSESDNSVASPSSEANVSFQVQVARLSDTSVPAAQRQSMAIEIGRVTSNRYLQRVINEVKKHRQRETATDNSTTHNEPGSDENIDLKLTDPDMTHSLTSQLIHPQTRFRLPTFDKVKAANTDKDLNIPENVIKGRVTELLERMKFEKRLKTKDDVPTIIAKMFPGPGKIDEAAFNSAVDVADRTQIYQSIFDAATTVKPADKARLQANMKDAADLIAKVEADATGLTNIFGAKAAQAKINYGKARLALTEVSSDMDNKVSTDYNLDDPEVGLGGWANFGMRHMHLLVEIIKGTDPNETKATLIHEASHLSNSSVDDFGYYSSPSFEAMSEDEKINNAAHYEELPRRLMGVSSYTNQPVFKPGEKVGGKPMTYEDKIRRMASEYLRMAWDAAVDTHTFIRKVRVAKLKGDSKPFEDNKALIREISKLMDLTIHEQAAGKTAVTTIDVTLTESIAHGITIIQNFVDTVPFPPEMVWSDTGFRDQIVDGAVAKYNNLLKDPKRDRALLDWLVAHYRKLP